MQCTVLADNQDRKTQASAGVNAPGSLILCPGLGNSQLQPAFYQDLTIFKESQKYDPGGPCLQARGNVTMKPSLTCLELPTLCMLPPPVQLSNEGLKAGLSPTHGTILTPDNLIMFQ